MSSGSAPANRDDLIAELVGLTALPPSEAEQYLTAGNWDIQNAASLYFDGSGPQGQDDAPSDDEMADEPESNPSAQEPQQGGGRTLGGDYVPSQPSASSSGPAQSGASRAPQRGVRSLRDLQAGGGGHGHAHEDDDDDDDKDHDFFTGGEKSGLAVQNPGAQNPQDHINNILKRARQNVARPGGDDEQQPATNRFTGTGMTLGGDDAPSRAIPDPQASIPQPPPRAHRELHLWRDGFSVDDGPLFRYDDPANARTLEMINTGHAPLHILNVEHGQEVDVEVHPHKEEDYKKPKKKYVPFSGGGQRLGSPTPGASSSAAPPPAPAATTTASTSAGASATPSVEVDSSQPTVTLQIRLGDGTRLQSRFNTTHTVGDVYSFVNAASAASLERNYALMTTFPSKELSDKGQVLGDMAELKRGGAVVQKWT